MILKTILFFIVAYLLIRVVSNLFLSSGNRKRSNVRFFYKTFKNVRDQQKRQQQKQERNKKPEERLDDIEEAEYEDVTEDKDEPKSK